MSTVETIGSELREKSELNYPGIFCKSRLLVTAAGNDNNHGTAPLHEADVVPLLPRHSEVDPALGAGHPGRQLRPAPRPTSASPEIGVKVLRVRRQRRRPCANDISLCPV